MIILVLYVFSLVLVTSAVAMAAVQDVRRFQIPNIFPGLALVSFGVFYAALLMIPDISSLQRGVSNPISQHIASGIMMFILTFGLFAMRIFGAGDAKLMSALALWVGVLDGLPLFIFYMSLCGGVLGIATLLLKQYKLVRSPKPGSWIASAQAGENRVPYGVAIAIGFIMTLLQLGHFDIMSVNNLLENGG